MKQPHSLDRRERIGRMLNGGQMTLTQIALNEGITRQRVSQIRREHFPNLLTPPRFRRAVIGHIRESGANYCPMCHQVKCAGDFMPAASVKTSGYVCKACNAERVRRYHQANPEVFKAVKARSTERAANRNAIADLQRFAPDLAQAVRKGEITLEDALERMPPPPPTSRVRFIQIEPTVFGFIVAITERLLPEEIAELKAQL